MDFFIRNEEKNMMKEWHTMNLNIRYDLPSEFWDKVPLIYAEMEGWLGFGTGGINGQKGIPYWYSYDTNEKHISASVEHSGLAFEALMELKEWETWSRRIKIVATRILGYKVGEIELGEVGEGLEWIMNYLNQDAPTQNSLTQNSKLP